MTTIILGLGALIIVLGYIMIINDKKIEILEHEINMKNNVIELLVEDHIININAEKEKWRNTSSCWLLEKEQEIDRLGIENHEYMMKYEELKYDENKKIKELEQEKFEQLHELALMLNDSYHVDKILLEKAEQLNWLTCTANRKQRREFIMNGYVEL